MTAKKQTKPAAEAGTLVYCGPTIPGVAKQFTSYRGGIPEALALAQADTLAKALAAAQKQTPVLGGLTVPLDKLPEAMRQLREKTGPIYALYRKAQKRN